MRSVTKRCAVRTQKAMPVVSDREGDPDFFAPHSGAPTLSEEQRSALQSFMQNLEKHNQLEKQIVTLEKEVQSLESQSEIIFQ
jgi:hypothetical protein